MGQTIVLRSGVGPSDLIAGWQSVCGEALLGKKVGRKALVWGAVIGTWPGLDVFNRL